MLHTWSLKVLALNKVLLEQNLTTTGRDAEVLCLVQSVSTFSDLSQTAGVQSD